MPRHLPLVVLALLVAAPNTPAAARQASAQERPVFKTGVDLIQVDVVVLDRDGRPVRGLRWSDFTLIDRGVSRPIAALAEMAHDRPYEPDRPRGVAADVGSNQTARSDRLVMIVLDDLHFRGRTDEAKALVRRVVDGVGAEASLGLVTTSGNFGVEVTEDRQHLIDALERFLDGVDPARAHLPRPQVPVDTGTSIRAFGPPDLASFFSPLQAYKAVEDVARKVGADDGRRKAFVWISAGVPGATRVNDALRPPSRRLGEPCPAGATAGFQCDALRAMFRRLRQSGVTVYTVDPGGPRDGGRALRDIAEETGGFAVASSDLDAGITRLLADLDNYYLIGFHPDPGDDDYRDIEVRVNREGVTVRHRRGYHAGGPPSPPKNREPLGALVAPVMPRTDLPLRINAVPFFTNGSDAQVLITLEVDLGTLPAPNALQQIREQLQFAVFAVDLRKKKVTRSAGRRVEIEWPLEDGQPSGSPRFLVQTVLTLPAGAYQLRASAMAARRDVSGSVYLQMDVPAPGGQAVALSGVAVASDRGSDLRVVHSRPLAGVSIPFAPSLDRTFTRDAVLRLFFQVRRARPETNTAGWASLVAEDGTEARRVRWEAVGRVSAVNPSLPLSGLAPGKYRVRVSADGALVERAIGFRIE